jgi:hypothetical protein
MVGPAASFPHATCVPAVVSIVAEQCSLLVGDFRPALLPIFVVQFDNNTLLVRAVIASATDACVAHPSGPLRGATS